MKAILYTRALAGESQADKNITSGQITELHTYAKAHGFDTGEVIFDDVAENGMVGTKGFEILLEKIASGGYDTVITYSLTRFAKNINETLKMIEIFIKKRITFHAMVEGIDTSTLPGQVVVNAFAALSELEKQNKTNRLKPEYNQTKNNKRINRGSQGKKPAPHKLSALHEPDEKRIIGLMERMM